MKGRGWFQRKGRYILLVLALVCMGMGIMRQEHAAVLQKAINICLECIGVG